MTAQLLAREQRIPPTRGLVFTNNNEGKALALIAVQRWVRFTRLVLKADKIVVMNEGRIMDIGRHVDLVARNAIYAQMVELQFGESAIAEAQRLSAVEGA